MSLHFFSQSYIVFQTTPNLFMLIKDFVKVNNEYYCCNNSFNYIKLVKVLHAYYDHNEIEQSVHHFI